MKVFDTKIHPFITQIQDFQKAIGQPCFIEEYLSQGENYDIVGGIIESFIVEKGFVKAKVYVNCEKTIYVNIENIRLETKKEK